MVFDLDSDTAVPDTPDHASPATDDPVITAHGLTKRYDDVLAVDRLSFDVHPGAVTGFLGPNGSGKTTTFRMLLGLAAPTAGSAHIFGVPYDQLVDPITRVGVLIDSSGYHPSRTAIDHLRAVAIAAGIDRQRAAEVLHAVGLDEAAHRRAGGFSTGMRQRLGLAAALLGDPELLILDEPANGLDPAGIRWLREFLRSFVDQGRAVLLSSHVLAEVAQVADNLIIIDKGTMLASGPMHELLAATTGSVHVQTPQPEPLIEAVEAAGGEVRHGPDGGLTISGLDGPAVGELAHLHGVVLHELHHETTNLEDAFLALTEGARP